MSATHPQISQIESLRAQILALERRGSPTGPGTLPFGIDAIDRHLPGGGLTLGAVHDVQAAGPDTDTGALPTSFAAGILARRPGPVLWIGRERRVFGPGLVQAGLDPGRVVFVDAGRAVPLATEDALRHPGTAGVVAELDGKLDGVVSRRLQLAAEGSGTLGILIRLSQRFDDPALNGPSSAATRWRIGPVPSPPALAHAPDVNGLPRPHWQLSLLRCRGSAGASWIVESADAQGRLALASVLANGPAVPARRHAAVR